MDEMKKKAKMDMLKMLHKMASDSLGKSMSDEPMGMEKVSVMAKDKSGLKEGLDKAKEIVDRSPQELEEASGMEDESSEEEHMSAEELDREIERLKQLREKMSGNEIMEEQQEES